MKTLTILVRRAAARWVQKHRASCQAQPEQHIPAGEAVQKTADEPASEERKAEKAAERRLRRLRNRCITVRPFRISWTWSVA